MSGVSLQKLQKWVFPCLLPCGEEQVQPVWNQNPRAKVALRMGDSGPSTCSTGISRNPDLL